MYRSPGLDTTTVWYTSPAPSLLFAFLRNWAGAATAQLVALWAPVLRGAASPIPPISELSAWADFFSLRVNKQVVTPLPTTLSDESINRSVICARKQSIARTQKILTFTSLSGESWQQKHALNAPSTKTECG